MNRSENAIASGGASSRITGISNEYTVRGYSGKTMLAAEKGFYWRIELQYPLGQTGRVLYARMENFDAEKHLFPESSTYMDFLMKKKTKQP